MPPDGDVDHRATLRTVLEKRSVLATLARSGDADVRELVAATDYSHSTINRTVNDLEAMGLVSIGRSASRHTYDLTFLGRQLLAVIDCGRELLSARAMFAAVPAAAELPPWIVVDASVEIADGTVAPHHVFDQIDESVGRADRLDIVAPVLTRDVTFTNVVERVFAGELTVELVFPQDHVDAVSERFADRMERLLASDAAEVHSLGDETVPYALGICYRERSDGSLAAQELGIICYDEQRHNATGTLVTDSPAAIAWAERRFAQYRQRSRRVRAIG